MIHINDAMIEMLPEKHNIVNLSCWQKDGSIMHLNGYVCIKVNKASGTRLMKNIKNQAIIREVRTNLIFSFNNDEVCI